MSEQISSLPLNTSWLSGTEATGVGAGVAVGGTLGDAALVAAGVVAAALLAAGLGVGDVPELQAVARKIAPSSRPGTRSLRVMVPPTSPTAAGRSRAPTLPKVARPVGSRMSDRLHARRAGPHVCRDQMVATNRRRMAAKRGP